MTYYYAYSELEDRGMIHTSVLKDFDSRGTVEADSWLAAKAAFGFDLTPLQQTMLAALGRA